MKDIYVYEGTNILINKLGIKDEKELDSKESFVATLNTANLLKSGFNIKSVNDIKIIHKHLFGDIYEWAGQNRKINMIKEEPVLNGLSVVYSNYRDIDNDLKKLDARFKSIDWKKLKHREAIDKLVIIISNLWQIHCFREGNTRTVTLFMYFLMKQIKMNVDTKFIGEHAKYFRNALVLASIGQYSEYNYLTDILLDSISFKNIDKNKYQTIRDYEVEKYEYRAHKYKD